MTPEPLAQLRDIHLPEAVGWWPPAPGWWLLALLLVAALVYGLLWWRRRRARLYFRGQASQLLQTCWQDYHQNGQHRAFLDTLFEILKRVRLSAEHGKTPSQTGDDDQAQAVSQASEVLSSTSMFELLDHSSGGELGKHVHRTHIEQLLYQPHAEPLNREQCQALYRAARHYLKRVHRQC